MKRRHFLKSSFGAAVATSLPFDRSLGSFYRVAQEAPPDIRAVRGEGGEVTLKGAAIREFKDALRGRLLMAGEQGYEQARHILNPSFDKHPALIAQVTGLADIKSAVDFAREHELLVAVKCGGHSASGKSTCDGGMMIDLSPFRSVRVDPVGRTARVAGGSLLGLLDHEAMSFGLVTPMGTVSHTGVGGLTTGGGFGRVARRFGLSLDNVTAVDVIAADGKFYRASETENPDLFWGVRGGGGNFGIVTSFEFRLFPTQREVIGGDILYPIAKAKDLLTLYAEYGAEAPDELYLDAFLVNPPGGQDGMCGFSICYSGQTGAEKALAPLRSLGTPIADNFRTMDYVALQKSGDIDDPRAQGQYLKGGFIPGIEPDLVTAIVEGFEGHPNRTTLLFFQHSGGAIGRVDPNDTAFAHRYAFANMMTAVGWRMGDDPSAHIGHLRQYYAGLEPFTRGFYINDMDPDAGGQEVNANFRGHLDKLVQIKNKYDPTNLFRLNANVSPTV
jgi:FAD/FMN-containing dehydrogenase